MFINGINNIHPIVNMNSTLTEEEHKEHEYAVCNPIWYSCILPPIKILVKRIETSIPMSMVNELLKNIKEIGY